MEPTPATDAIAFPANRPLRIQRHLGVLGVGVGAFLLFRLFALLPGLVETLYATTVGPLIVQPLSLLVGLLPLALVELVLIFYVTWLVVLTGRTAREVARRQRDWRNALAGGGLRMARDAGVMLVGFYALWGFNYARRPLSERLGWPAWNAPEIEALISLAEQSVESTNAAYWALHETEDAGHPTQDPPDLGALDRALETGWQRAAELLDLPGSTSRRYGRVKRLVLTPIVARFGIVGFYFPWTAEATVLWDSPAVTRPASMAHEKAHQRGIGPESEASFLGFVAASLSPSPHARYSATVFAQQQLLASLARADREVYGEVAARRFPGVLRDLADLAEYWRQFQGVGTAIGRMVNDRYLRANRVQGGVLSYGRSVRLLITHASLNDGRLIR
ncbi:MAG: DUF3810 domain-containing protein [Gemmatimonadetes bacterium]|nr:DUF3810 domain-containing protein [Gemmatimonadota bacterium]